MKKQLIDILKKTIFIIPARLASSRLENKPLYRIKDTPILGYVLDHFLSPTNNQLSDIPLNVAVATCDNAIKDIVDPFGFHTVITDPDLPSGSDRIYQALLSLDQHQQYDYIINLQGDMVRFDLDVIFNMLLLHDQSDFDITTMSTPLEPKDAAIESFVKVAADPPRENQLTKAFYFSRSPIPHKSHHFMHHHGVYIYNRHALKQFVEAVPSTLEKIEKLEQLRALSIGLNIGLYHSDADIISIDTPQDARAFEKLL